MRLLLIYRPSEGGRLSGRCGVFVWKIQEQKGNYDEYVIRHLQVTRLGGETRKLTHLHYTEFPDRGIPKCVPSLLNLIELMRDLQPANFSDAPPVVVHCRCVVTWCRPLPSLAETIEALRVT